MTGSRNNVDTAQIPRFSDPAIEETVWALVRLWSGWAGDPDPDRSYWRDLLEAAQPAHARPADTEGAPPTGSPAAPARPAQLPLIPADFDGRIQELNEVKALCSPSGPGPVIVVHGIAGVGKSALTTCLAHDLAPSYPDGQLFNRLREDQGPLESGTALARFLRALGVPAADMPDDLASRAALYRTLLSGRQMLILLDDAASEAQVRPLLPATNGCLILVTSRNPLPGLEGTKTYRLGLLDQEEAERLLARIAGKDKVGAGETASREVVNLCGRLPLAIRIAAARLRARTDWTVAHLAELLADARRTLRELHAGDLDVRAAFELSYRSLDNDAARLFRLLRVRPGPTFSTELAVEMAGKPVPEVEELLDRLILDQLLEPLGTPGRYGMHRLIWLFAAELLSQSDEERRAMRAMNIWYAQKTMQVIAGLHRQTLPDDLCPFTPAEALAWLDDEEQNLFRLLVQCVVTGNDTLTAAAAHPIVVITRERGLWAERDWALDRGLAAARRVGDRTTQAMLLYERGEGLAGHRSAWTEALACWTEALALIDPADNLPLAVSLRDRLAHAYRALGRHEDAGREMTAVAETIAADDSEGAKLLMANFQAPELLAAGRPGQVIALLEPLIPVMERSDPETEVWGRLHLGKAYAFQQRYTQAIRQLVLCRRLCREYGLRKHEPEVLLELGAAYRGHG